MMTTRVIVLALLIEYSMSKIFLISTEDKSLHKTGGDEAGSDYNDHLDYSYYSTYNDRSYSYSNDSYYSYNTDYRTYPPPRPSKPKRIETSGKSQTLTTTQSQLNLT